MHRAGAGCRGGARTAATGGTTLLAAERIFAGAMGPCSPDRGLLCAPEDACTACLLPVSPITRGTGDSSIIQAKGSSSCRGSLHRRSML